MFEIRWHWNDERKCPTPVRLHSTHCTHVQQLPALLCSHYRAPPCTHFFQFGTALLLQLPAIPNTRTPTELSLFLHQCSAHVLTV
jgi:hypothetical protein